MKLPGTDVLLFIILCSCSQSIRLGKQEGKLLKDTLQEFEDAPENGRFERVIEMSHANANLIPKIFIWCPIRHNQLTILCPVHNYPLRIGHWTDLMDSSRADPRNPRLIYDLNGNIILVQAFYECSEKLPEREKTGHHYLSASNEILDLLPSRISRTFPIVMQQRSGFTLRLYDYVICGIYQGQNFMELSEGIASMNYRQLMRNNPDSENIKDEFDRSVFCSFPSNDKLMDFFLQQFQKTKKLYESDMSSHTGTVLSCDHTFRTSKHIGVTREDGKFVKQFQNVFLGLNEHGEVLTWRYTRSTVSSEIEDLLKELKDRLDKVDISLKMILVDDCCHVVHLYNRIFPGVKVKLDLFHACMRVVQTISKSESHSKKFARELSMIFRQNGDLGDERTMSTPCPDEIEANLERLLFVWGEKLSKEMLHQIENLRKHIQKGCLSDIPVGCGTETNERLHRHLNRSLLCGVSKIGPELAVAVMTCALYAWNCKRKAKSSQNKRTTPVVPVEIVKESKPNSSQHHMKQSAEIKSAAHSTLSTSEKGLDEVKTETVLNYIIQRVLYLQDFFSSITARCKNKSLDMISLLWSTGLTVGKLMEDESKLNSLGLDLTAQHSDNLTRNLSGLNLTVDKVAGDGNCYFRAVARQLRKHLVLYREQIEAHCTLLGLGRSEDEDTRKLRELFVKEISENIDAYKDWMTTNSHLEEIDKFNQDGYFASEVGDLCVKATATFMRIPVVVVTALPTQPTVPFLPREFVTTTPIFIAYDHSGPGQYDATKGMGGN